MAGGTNLSRGPPAQTPRPKVAPGFSDHIWFTETAASKVGRITFDGQITEFAVPTPNSAPRAITLAADGALWFAGQLANRIGRIDTSGMIREFPIPTPNSFPRHITPGPDGAVWFTEFNTNKLGRIDQSGIIVEYLLPSPNRGHGRIVTGADGNRWFTENNLNRIGRMTPEAPYCVGLRVQLRGMVTGTAAGDRIRQIMAAARCLPA